MNAVFADTFYFLALLNKTDEAHENAGQYAADRSKRLVTTAWVLTELADGLAGTGGRSIFRELVAELEKDGNTQIIPANPALWQRGIDLYAARPDKEWSLTDCISFVVMGDMGITDALTADHHFEQAGFRTLLLK